MSSGFLLHIYLSSNFQYSLTIVIMREHILLILLPPLISTCSDFWVSECHLDQDEVITQVPLPSQDDDIKICQDLCNTQVDCTHWQWSGPKLTCTLLKSSYLSRCHNVSSTLSPEISTCLPQDSGTCADIVDEDCEMSGTVLFQDDAVIDAVACQEYLQLLGPVYGAKVFFFSDLEGVCYLLDSADRACVSMSGPVEPSVEKCDEDTTTTTTKATTSTSTTTTTTDTTTTATESGIVNYMYFIK